MSAAEREVGDEDCGEQRQAHGFAASESEAEEELPPQVVAGVSSASPDAALRLVV